MIKIKWLVDYLKIFWEVKWVSLKLIKYFKNKVKNYVMKYVLELKYMNWIIVCMFII